MELDKTLGKGNSQPGPTFSADAGKVLRQYHFHQQWEGEYFVVPYGEGCTCLICGYVFGTNKKFNIQRHYVRYHNAYDKRFPKESAIRQQELKLLKTRTRTVQNKQTTSATITPPNLVKNAPMSTTILSYKIASILAKGLRPFEEIDMAKEIMKTTVNELLEDDVVKNDLSWKIDNLPLSQNSVTKRMKAIAVNLSSQMRIDILECKYFSLQITDSYQPVNDKIHVKIFVRIVFDDCRVLEELLAVLQINGQSSAEEMFIAFRNTLRKHTIPLNKLVSITAGDGSSTLCSRENGLIALCKKDPYFRPAVNFRCLIHQLSLCASSIDASEVVTPIKKIVDLIKERPSIENQTFKKLLEEAEKDDRSESFTGSRILENFIQVLPEIKTFVNSSGKDFEVLNNRLWLEDLYFFADMINQIDELCVKLKTKNASIWTLVSYVGTFRETVSLWIGLFRINKVSDKFTRLEELLKESGTLGDFCGDRFACRLEGLKESLCKRYLEFYTIEVISKYLQNPMAGEDTDKIASRILDLFPSLNKATLTKEMTAFRQDDKNRLKITANGNVVEKFWPTIDESSYRNLVNVFKKILSCFGTSNLCDSVTDLIKKVKFDQGAQFNDDYLDSLMKISVSTYKPNYETICADERSEFSY